MHKRKFVHTYHVNLSLVREHKSNSQLSNVSQRQIQCVRNECGFVFEFQGQSGTFSSLAGEDSSHLGSLRPWFGDKVLQGSDILDSTLSGRWHCSRAQKSAVFNTTNKCHVQQSWLGVISIVCAHKIFLFILIKLLFLNKSGFISFL